MVDGRVQAWLEHFLGTQNAVAGTVHSHFRSKEKTGLQLVAAVNVPAKVQEIVAWVPPGKGMAGQALVQGVPIQICNLKDDRSGSVRPGARAVDAQAAVALPVKSSSGEISAVVGIAYRHEHVFDPEELARLQEAAAGVVTELE